MPSVTPSDAEKTSLQDEITRLELQLAGTGNDFERIATGVEVALFAEKKPETFSWKEEFAALVEPAIKELKRLTIRTRNKTRLKDTIHEYDKLAPVALDAVQHLVSLSNSTEDVHIREKIENLLPEWQQQILPFHIRLLDLLYRVSALILADFKGELAEIYSRLERSIQQWCVEACTINDWEIPFPQLTFHWPEKENVTT